MDKNFSGSPPGSTTPREEVEHDLIHLFMHTDRLHRQAVENALGDLRIHPSQHRILYYLQKSGSAVSQHEIASHFQISDVAVTASLKKLESEGYAVRCVAEGDLRRKEIRITPAGQELLASTFRRFSQVDAAMLRDFTDGELKVLSGFLSRMRTSLSLFCPDKNQPPKGDKE